VVLQVGDVIQDKYRIVGLLGQGGMGAVYEGENTAIARRVAIKVLFGAVAEQKGVVERFEREAQAAGRIGNDHILEVLDMGTLDDGNRFMVMEFLDGETMGERSKRVGPMSAHQVYPLAKQLLVGLAAAHRANIIHRDLKPDNVFILKEKAGQPDFVKIIDFGISKFTALDQDMKMTATGAVMGTPYFMSPEQAKGGTSTDIRSDLYAVGVILYKAVTGQVPFDGETFNELLFKIVLSPMPQPRALVPELDPAFETLVQKAMARAPERRFQTAEEFIAALDNWKGSGAAVTVPPPEETGLGTLGMTAGPSPGNTQVGISPTATNVSPATTNTDQSWSNTDAGAAALRRSHTGLFVGLGVGGVALLAAALYLVAGGEPTAEDDPDVDETAAAAAEPMAAEPANAPRVAPVEAEPEPEPREPEPSEANPATAKAPRATAEPVKEEQPEAAPTDTAPAVAPPPRRPSRPRPVAKPKKKASPDFGY
jgi:serine/threonine-protein kinase